jgi:hypothetical protein
VFRGVFDLIATEVPFVIKNLATSNVLEDSSADAERVGSIGLGGVVARKPHYRSSQLWQICEFISLGNGSWEVCLRCVLTGLEIKGMAMRPANEHYYTLGLADGIVDECTGGAYIQGCHAVKLHPATSFKRRHLWILELPFQNLLAYVYGAGMMTLTPQLQAEETEGKEDTGVVCKPATTVGVVGLGAENKKAVRRY